MKKKICLSAREHFCLCDFSMAKHGTLYFLKIRQNSFCGKGDPTLKTILEKII